MISPKDLLKPLLADRATRILAAAAVFLDLAGWAAAGWQYWAAHGADAVSLHYNVYLNVNDVGAAWRLFVSPGIGLVILLLNVGLAAGAYRRSRQNAVAFLAVTVFYELLILAAGAFMLFINRVS